MELAKILLHACRLHHTRYSEFARMQETVRPEDLSEAILNYSLAGATQCIVAKPGQIVQIRLSLRYYYHLPEAQQDLLETMHSVVRVIWDPDEHTSCASPDRWVFGSSGSDSFGWFKLSDTLPVFQFDFDNMQLEAATLYHSLQICLPPTLPPGYQIPPCPGGQSDRVKSCGSVDRDKGLSEGNMFPSTDYELKVSSRSYTEQEKMRRADLRQRESEERRITRLSDRSGLSIANG